MAPDRTDHQSTRDRLRQRLPKRQPKPLSIMGSSPPGLNDLHINGNPKNQLHDSIEKIQSLHKRKNALKATYDHERSDLRARHEKSTQALEGLICSTEEQVQSIGEVPYPDFADVKIKLHSVMKDAEALYDNVSALDNAMNQALDSWYRKENEKTASEIKGAEVGYKRAFDAWHEGIKTGNFFDDMGEPSKPRTTEKYQSPTKPEYSPAKVNGADMEQTQIPIHREPSYTRSIHDNREPLYYNKQENGSGGMDGGMDRPGKRSTLSKIEGLFKPDRRRASYASAA